MMIPGVTPLNGNRKPVALVRIVNSRKIAVRPGIGLEPSSPNMTMRPATIPISSRRSGAIPTGPREARPDVRLRIEPGMTRLGWTDQTNMATGLNRRTAPMITITKNTSATPWITANAGPDGGLPGASAVSAGIFRKLWMISTNTLR